MEHRRGIAALFDFLPTVHLFIKDRASRFVPVSAHNLTLLGAQHEADVIGKTDLDFFLPEVAERYIQEDRQVMQTQRASANRAWMVPDASGLLQWFPCTKIPLFDRGGGEVIGLAGTLQ
ncbi:MAG: PAS domain-containing protein [Planctomycetota bacterium]